jgi:lipopolysaccharide exporter
MSAQGTGGGSLFAGAAWMIAMRWVTRCIGLVSTVILARLLTPDDFGVVAIALLVVGLLETVSYLGVDLSLIKNRQAGREDFDSAWTIQLGQGALIAAVLLLSAPLVASFFNEPRAAAVVAVLAARPIIEALQNIGIVNFRKDLDFAREFRFNLIAKVLGALIQLTAAVVFRNYWALVTGMLAAALVATVLSYAMHPYRPRLSLARAGKIFSFSQWLLVARLGSYLSRRADEFLVGRLIGTSAMGGYRVVNELASAPTTEIIMPMRRALFPALAQFADDNAAYQRTVAQTLGGVTVICVGLGVGLACVAELVVPLVLGSKWLETIPIMRWLALLGTTTAIILVLEVPLWVADRTRLSALITWIELIVALPLLYAATVRWGIEGAAASRVLVSVLMLPVAAVAVRSACGVGLLPLLRAVVRPTLAGGVMAAAMLVLPTIAASIVLALLAKVAVGALVYLLVLWALWMAVGRPDGLEAAALRRLRARLARRDTRPD